MTKKQKARGGSMGYSKLKDHRRNKKLLIPPIKTVGNFQLQSWMNDRMPETLWAVLLSSALPRESYLSLFRGISDSAVRFRGSKIFLTHTELSKLNDDDFEGVFEKLLNDASAISALLPLKLFKELPDIAHWTKRLPQAASETAWQDLSQAVARCLFHQSEASTDIRWLKIRFLLVQHRIQIPEAMRQLIEEILDFPDKGDLRKVRPRIRAMESMSGMPDMFPTAKWPENFWNECFSQTACSSNFKSQPSAGFPHEETNKLWAEIYAATARHCVETISTTAIDPRHDGVFGLALYGLTLVASMFRPHSTRPGGRVVLRALVETYLTLAYLVAKDQPSLWTSFRNYGGGQAKLAFLKLTESSSTPQYVDVDTLEALANEDAWLEYVDIDLGHWAKKDLRQMSEEIGVKDIYDKYYGWPSAFVHGQWGAIRNTVFEQCLNPLHRLHRIPRPPRLDLEDVSWDALKLGNLIIDTVNKAYPTLKTYFRVTPNDPNAHASD